ncbi:MAG: hypothetical protein IKF97_02145 [Clostridia bacterium]|nr:hypothetical protein [Clostridia bacterium]
MDISVFSLLSYFIIYSFLGWILESVFRSFCEKRIINTGFLIGPFCPIYGSGALIMLLTMGQLKGNYVLIFVISVLMLTFWEYIVGVFLEKVFKTKYWDYSDHKIQFQGRICLTNSIAWGFLGVGFINIIHPFLISVLDIINPEVFKIIIYTATGIVILDTIVSIIKVKHIKIKLNKVEELNEQIKQKMAELKGKVQEKSENVLDDNEKNTDIEEKNKDKNKMAENVQSAIKELKMKRDKMFDKLYKYVERLKSAFPKINSKEITEVLNKKITLKKKETEEKRRK